MLWQVKIHTLVLSDDLDKIPKADKAFILKTLNKKLAIDPQAFGKALTGDLKGLWRLRVRDYRVVYKIHKNKIVVLVIKIGIRKDDEVYLDLVKRLKKI